MEKTYEQYREQIYALSIFDSMQVGNQWIERVPGGWIYSYLDGSRVFVPFNNEFQKAEGKQ